MEFFIIIIIPHPLEDGGVKLFSNMRKMYDQFNVHVVVGDMMSVNGSGMLEEIRIIISY